MATTASNANMTGSPTRPGPCPELRGSPRAHAGLGDGDAASTARPGSNQGEPEPRRCRRPAGRSRRFTSRPRGPPRRGRAPPARRRRSAVPATMTAGACGPRRAPASPRPVHRGQDQRPAEPGGDASASPASIEAGDAGHDRVLDRRDLLDPQPDRGRADRSRPARDRRRRRPSRPIRGRPRRARRRAPRRRSAIESRPFTDLEGTRARGDPRGPPSAAPSSELQPRPAEDEGTVRVVLEVGPPNRSGR